MIQSDYDGIAIGINSALVLLSTLIPGDPAEYARARAHNTSVATTARCVAVQLGQRQTNFNLQQFADECGMEVGSDGTWRVPGGTFVPSDGCCL